MKEKILMTAKRILNSELISGSFYLFLGTLAGNVLAFVLNLFLVRLLSYAQYAEITAIVSLITLISIPSIAFLPTIVQFAGRYFARSEFAEAAELFRQSTIKIFVLAIILIALFIVFASFLANFLHITNSFEIVISGIVVGSMYISITNTAFLQSLLKFQFLAFTLTLGGVLKLLLSIGFLFAGFGIAGILWGYFLAFVIPLLITFIPLKSFTIKKLKEKTKIHNKEIFVYGLPAAIAIFSLSSFTSTDILLVKHFFPSSTAAMYSGLSLVGRIIFYFSAPISTVMFPLVTKRFHSGKNPRSLLYASFLLVLAPSLLLTILYFSFPHVIISLVLGKHYYAVAGYLGWFGLYLSIFSLLNISVNFLLSIKKTSVSYVIAVGAILQIVGINLFHGNVASIIAISLILSLVLFAILLLYYQKTYGSTQKATH